MEKAASAAELEMEAVMRTLLAIAAALFVSACATQPQSGYVGTAATAQKQGVAYKDKPGQQLPQAGAGAFRVSR